MKIKFEDFSLNENIMNIIELANMTNRMELDNNVILKMLQTEFKKRGDDGVIKMYKGITGVNIEALGKGRYIFSKSNHNNTINFESFINEKLNTEKKVDDMSLDELKDENKYYLNLQNKNKLTPHEERRWKQISKKINK
jgi:hypothetical protein